MTWRWVAGSSSCCHVVGVRVWLMETVDPRCTQQRLRYCSLPGKAWNSVVALCCSVSSTPKPGVCQQAWVHKLSRAAGPEDLKMKSHSTLTPRAGVLEPVAAGRTLGQSSSRELGSRPALPLVHCVSLDMSYPLPGPTFSCVYPSSMLLGG